LINQIEIFNLQGQSIQVINNPKSIEVVSHLKAGTYFLKFETDAGFVTKKFSKI
jgi:hypothetical protein